MTNKLDALKLIDTAAIDMQVAGVLLDAHDFDDLASIKIRKALEMSLLSLVVFHGIEIPKSRSLKKIYHLIEEYMPLDEEDIQLLLEANERYSIHEDRFNENYEVDKEHLEQIIILEEYISTRAEKIIMQA